MTKIQFEVLRMFYENNIADIEMCARLLYKPEETIGEAVNILTEEGYLDAGAVTEKGRKLLDSHKINNAVILAAGMSSRFVPLNFEIPKGLLQVKGERLIERQIEQLREKGIEEIIIVVGYMKEAFEYLTEKYGVILVETDEYEIKNNHSSVYAAKKYLKNTIITSSDLYFSENIFQTYAFDSYYCTLYMSGKTAERGIETDEDDRILKTFYGDKCYDVWVTLGYAFFSEKFSKKMLEILDEEYHLPQTANKFWADIQDEHLSELYMYAKRVDEGIIHEFDSLEELREFDSKYVNDSGSGIMKKICYLLGVKERNIIGLTSLKRIKSSLFKFRCKGDTYICDVEPDETEKITYDGRVYYQCRDIEEGTVKLFKMDKNIRFGGKYQVDINKELDQLYEYSKEFKEYHRRYNGLIN